MDWTSYYKNPSSISEFLEVKMRIYSWYWKCTYIQPRKKALRKEIRKQFKLGTQGVRAEHKNLLRGDVNSILNSTIREQKYWVHTLRLSCVYVT